MDIITFTGPCPSWLPFGTTIWDPFWVALMVGGFLVLGAWVWVNLE